MIARALRPDDVILWPESDEWWWVKASRPADPDDVLDGPWRVAAEQLTGLQAQDPQVIRAEDVDPEDDFPLIGWDA